jgi:3-deoxy-7-phosphoheptulonate synthase
LTKKDDLVTSPFMINRYYHTEILPSPGELYRELPLSLGQRAFINQVRSQLRDILQGRSPRKLLIVGPCSIHNIAEAREYADRLKALASRTEERFLLIMRAYFEKPRTALGWKGLLYDPHLNGQPNLKEGLTLARRFLLEMADMKVPAATEFLDPFVHFYLGDLIAWGCVGARTSSSQIHRQMASLLPLPVGFKNAIDGDCSVAINSILSAATPHALIGLTADGRVAQLQSTGNPHCHLVLRGGDSGPNFDAQTIHRAALKLQALGLPTQLLVDCAHDNSGKDHRRQSGVFQDLLEQLTSGTPHIAGILMESYLCAGSQPPFHEPLRYGVSLTDACMDWESTEALLIEAHGRLSQTFDHAQR